jgi:Arc/MetJ family transcription regulator
MFASGRRAAEARYTPGYAVHMSKHLIDLDDDALTAARARLGTATLKDTVNEALRRAIERRRPRLRAALDTLGAADLCDRADAWR